MAKGALGRLGKLMCMLVKWRARSHGQPLADDDDGAWRRRRLHHDVEEVGGEDKKDVMGHGNPTEDADQKVPAGMHSVYVGKSRRRYLIGSHLASNPMFRVLVQRSGSVEKDDVHGGGGSTVLVGCEVVLFEHLLWMLENAADPQPEALDELVDFYSC